MGLKQFLSPNPQLNRFRFRLPVLVGRTRFALISAAIVICLEMATPGNALCAVPEIPAGAKTLSGIVLDIKRPLNRKLDALRRTYGIKKTKPGEFRFTDKSNQTVLTISVNRTLNRAKTRRVEEFLYRNGKRQVILHEKVITRGKDLEFHDLERRVFQAGAEIYDLQSTDETMKDAILDMGAGTVFRVLTSRKKDAGMQVKRHEISVGESRQLEISDTIHPARHYRTYTYRILDPQVRIYSASGVVSGWAQWLGTLRIAVRTTPGLVLPEITYEKIGPEGSVKLGDLKSFSGELHRNLIMPFVVNGPVQLVNRLVGSHWVWPRSRSVRAAGSQSEFLNQLIAIRNEVDRAETDPALLSQVKAKLNVIIKDIKEGTLKIGDSR